MGKGIKKISENVIADKRSLTLVVSSDNEIANTDAMPLGMLTVNWADCGLRIKIGTNPETGEGLYNRLDAMFSLQEKSIDNILINDSQVDTRTLLDDCVTKEKIMDGCIEDYHINITKNGGLSRLANDCIYDNHINPLGISKITDHCIYDKHIRTQGISTPSIADYSITENKIEPEAVTNSKIGPEAVTTDKIMYQTIVNDNIAEETIEDSKLVKGTITGAKIGYETITNSNLADACIDDTKVELQSIAFDKMNPNFVDDFISMLIGTKNINLYNAICHDGSRNVPMVSKNGSTVINDLYANRVYNVVYMDIAEGYIPGEDLEPGDIVAMHEDGKVYKARSINQCIVGVVSNEYANCLGASEEEILNKEKVAVGMIGKIHVKVKGPVRLGQRISISPNMVDGGLGVANWMNINNIGQALETVECGKDDVNLVLVQVRPM